MYKKNNKGKKLKRKASQDDLSFHKGPYLPNHLKHRLAFAKKRPKMSSQATSSSYSTTSSKDQHKDDNDESSKSQCDMCKLSYSSNDKLTEHLVSLMHHTRLEDAGENPKHDCVLCEKTFTDMPSYRDHIGTKNHLRNLELLRDPSKAVKIPNFKWNPIAHNRKENGPNNQEQQRYQRQGPFNHSFNNNSNPGWQPPNYPRGPNYDNFQSPNYLNILGTNLLSQFGFHNIGQQAFQQQQSYGGRQNNWHNNRNSYSRWDKHYDPRRVENYNGDANRNVPWGSGVANFRPYNGPIRNNMSNNFTQDNYDFCWDEQSFRQHEDFLANMDQGDQRDTVEFHPRGVHSENLAFPQSTYNKPDPRYNRRNEWDVSYNERKRPRNEDYPLDPTAKSSKSLEQEKDTAEKMSSQPHEIQSDSLDASKSKYTHENVAKAKSSPRYDGSTNQDKSSLDNASDTILERAEKLCKELREKREASSNQRASLLKSQTHHSLNDKMNNLKKSKQSYMKGHITDMQNDQISSGDNTSTKSTVSSVTAPPQTSKELSPQNKPHPSSKSKTLDEIRKSIEQSVLDNNSKNTSSSTSQGDRIRNRVRASSLSESSSSPHSSSRGRADHLADEARQTRPLHKLDGSSGISKAGSKQHITKENLNKMVNCPRSRTERLHLARMFHSRADKESSAHVSSRSNINLEGLYDSPDAADLEIDVGGNMPTIKFEDLSDDVRSQILGLIQDDFGITQNNSSNKNQNDLEIVGAEKRKSKKTVSNPEGKVTNEKDSADRKSKKKSLVSKSEKKNNVTSTSLSSYSKPISTDQSSFMNLDLVSLSKRDKGMESININDKESSESGSRIASSTATETQLNKKNSTDKVNSLTPSTQEQSSPNLTSENVLSRYPTILGTMGANRTTASSRVDTGNASSIDDGKDKNSVDSGRSSMSLPSSSNPLSTASSPPSSLYKSLSGSAVQTPTHSSISKPIEEAVSLLNSSPTFRSNLPKDASDTRSSIASSVGTDVSSNTMSELLTLSEQEESVKQEMMSMELRLTRLHRLLEQAVYQINKCTERRNELQDEEKSLTSRRLSLLREATSSTLQDSRSSAAASSVSIASSIQTNSDSNNNNNSERSSSQTLPSASDLPPTQENDSDRPETSLSRSEWLAKFSAYLPSGFISSNTESSNRNTSSYSQPAQTTGTNCSSKTVPSVAEIPTPTTSSTQLRLSSDQNRLQMVPERDLEPTVQKEMYVRIDPTSTNNSSDRFALLSKDVPAGESDSLPNTDKSPPVAQEFTSPIMYVGTIKSGAGQSKKDKVAPVMTLNSATLSSLFGGSSDLGENLNPVKIVGPGSHGELHKDISFPPVVRRPSIGSPRQEDSDIGSVASVASGSSLGEQITRYCRFTPGASADGHNPHDLSVILSGPSDTSDLRGLEEEGNFGESRISHRDEEDIDAKTAKLKEDAGNNRLYGRLDQESIKSAEALHLMERNNEVPSSTVDKKKKKRKTKHQRDSGIRGRSKPYVISSSSADENEANKKVEDNSLSSLEQRLRKSPESTNDDSSDQPNPSGRRAQSRPDILSLSPSKSDQGSEVTIAECDSSTNLGIVDTQSLNESSSRLKEMNDSFEKTFGRKPRDKSSFFRRSESTEGSVVILSDDNDNGTSHRNYSNSDVIDLCGDDDIQHSLRSEKFCSYPGNFGPVCFISCLDERTYVGFLHNGFKVFHLSSDDSFKEGKHYPISKLSCMVVTNIGDGDIVCAGTGHSVTAINMKSQDRKKTDLGTTVNCLHVVKTHLFAGLDTGEMCVRDIKSWKETNRYICSDCPIHCMASGTEGRTRVLCVASQDSTITVVDADRCLPLRILTGHTKTAFSVQVHTQNVFSGSGDGSVVIHNLHTARVEKAFKDNKGMVNTVFYSQGHLFTGGLDKLVRVYNVKTNKIVQVYYGAGMGVIKTIYVHQDKLLITGNSIGSVDVIKLNLKAKFPCKHKKCGLNFGLASHLTWHVEQDH